MADIRLIATDLDGTLVGTANEFHLYSDLRDAIAELRRENNALWVVCTGRSLGSFSEVISALRMLGAVPDMVVARHAYIYSRTAIGYLPHVFWNIRIMLIERASRRKAQVAVKSWAEMITGGSFGRAIVKQGPERLLIKLDSPEATNALFEVISKGLSKYLSLRLFKFKNEIDIRNVPFTKGLALSEIQKHLRISPENTLAVGDGHNDISMFLPHVSAMTGCPANAEPEVMLEIRAQKGHISRYPSLEGVLDIIQSQRRGLVNSSLPADWKDPEQKDGPKMRNPKKKKHKSLINLAIWLLGIYTVLCVFATYHMLPLSGLILLPLKLFVKVIVRVLG